MIKQTVTYTDYNGVSRTEDFWFHLNKAELMEMEVTGGYTNMLKRIVAAKDQSEILHTFKDLVLKAYGEKSEDGRFFRKTPELREAFSQSAAYPELFMKLSFDDEAASAFIIGIMPADIDMEEAKKEAQKYLNANNL